jgi:hypothetical protein
VKIFLETPALRFVTKKFADAISDLDAKIADSPVLAPLLGVEKKEIIATPFAVKNFDIRDIRPFLRKDLIEKTVKVSIKLEEQRRRRSSLAVAAYETPEGLVDSLVTDLFTHPKDSFTEEVLTRLKKSGAPRRIA